MGAGPGWQRGRSSDRLSKFIQNEQRIGSLARFRASPEEFLLRPEGEKPIGAARYKLLNFQTY
jgi:hypothetical protein